MNESPLAPPQPGSPVLGGFLEHFGLAADWPPRELLLAVCEAFSRLPYENLTKIIKEAAFGPGERARRHPLEVLDEHRRTGSGGTCFSLTALLLHLVRALGFRAEALLGDRTYGPNTHCALAVWLDGVPHLVDPGYLISRPVALPRVAAASVDGPFNEVLLEPREAGARLDLSTRQEGKVTYRLTLRTEPAGESEFLKAWDASFGWEMMRYPVLTRVAAGRQLYLQSRRLLLRGRGGATREELSSSELPAVISGRFGIDASLAAKALEVLARRGEPLG